MMSLIPLLLSIEISAPYLPDRTAVVHVVHQLPSKSLGESTEYIQCVVRPCLHLTIYPDNMICLTYLGVNIGTVSKFFDRDGGPMSVCVSSVLDDPVFH